MLGVGDWLCLGLLLEKKEAGLSDGMASIALSEYTV